MNENINPDTTENQDIPQQVTPENNTKNSPSFSHSTDSNSVETSVHGMSSGADDVNEALSREDITSMDSLFDIDDTPTDTLHDDKKPVIAFETPDLSQSDSDIADELVLGKIPIEVTVELGSFIVDAANSSNLSAGDVLTLNTICPGQVRLMCDDAEVGRGELVDINGQLGVQIVHNWSH